MLGANGALADIVGYVSIYAGPIHCLLPGPASSHYPDVLHADQQGCN